FVFLLLNLFGLVYSDDLNRAIPFMIEQVVYFAFFLLLNSSNRWHKIFIRLFSILSLVHLVGFVLQALSLDLLLDINGVLLANNVFSEFFRFMQRGVLVGFTGQPAISGYILSCILSLVLIVTLKT